jgi:hypothetical protein
MIRVALKLPITYPAALIHAKTGGLPGDQVLLPDAQTRHGASHREMLIQPGTRDVSGTRYCQ